MIADKVQPHHLERKALLYVRQSSAHQVLHNRESSALQYAMRDRLTALGWSEIEIIVNGPRNFLTLGRVIFPTRRVRRSTVWVIGASVFRRSTAALDRRGGARRLDESV